jgi:hypothetical protein
VGGDGRMLLGWRIYSLRVRGLKLMLLFRGGGFTRRISIRGGDDFIVLLVLV